MGELLDIDEDMFLFYLKNITYELMFAPTPVKSIEMKWLIETRLIEKSLRSVCELEHTSQLVKQTWKRMHGWKTFQRNCVCLGWRK